MSITLARVSSTDAWMLFAAVALVALAAFYGAAQTALSRMSATRAARMSEERPSRSTRRLVLLLENPARTLNILALVVLAAEVAAVALTTAVVLRLTGGGAATLTVSILVLVALIFVVAEVLPKVIALQHVEQVAAKTAWWVGLLHKPVAPLARLLIGVGNVLAPGRGIAEGPFVTEDHLREMIDVAESDEVIEESERAMIHSIFDLGDTVVREIMVPRTDMVVVSADDSLRAVLDVLLQAGHSRIPVYRDDRDKIVGLVYAKDILRRLHATGDGAGPWEDLLRPAHFVPELKRVDDLLRELQASKVHLALVVDEYGSTAGLVTIEDILEEIVGEIVDEYDVEEPLVEELGGGVWRVDARLPIDELNDLLGSGLPTEEWDTVGGLMFGLFGHVPSPGEHLEVDGLRLVAERVRARRIGKVIVRRAEQPPGDAQP